MLRDDLGFTTEQINSLTDEDMWAIADGLQEELSKAVGGFRNSVTFLVRLYLAEKGTDIQTGVQNAKRGEPL